MGKFLLLFSSCLLVLCLQPELSGGSLKTWGPSVSLSDPSLWMDGRTPCPGQKTTLPETVAFLPGGSDFSVGSELSLPADGMIAFPGGDGARATLNFLAEEKRAAVDGCDRAAGDAVFRPGDFKRWHDPANWKGGNAATPHLRRIPCRC